MAFSRPAGKHRAPRRASSPDARRTARRSARAAGVVTVAVGSVVTGLSSQALAADSDAPAARRTGLTQVLDVSDSLADEIGAQAAAQRQAADEAARATARAEAERKAEARAKEARAAEERAARAAERERLNAFRLPVAGSYVSTAYRSGGALWSSGSHTGIDFHAASGTPVVAVGAGTVVEAGWAGAYGDNVVLRMDDGTYTQYGHLSSTAVSVGQSVSAGQRIGLSGATGNTTGPHLHFEARTSAEYGSDIDPVAYLRSHGLNV
ncbi:M23 family metallopeptidase [Streptomyces sp. NPDC088725]|uniref:M23 family metallopeptidase n=1 Tax=Streptomyces sp. NPDC088725 TaxID=3365873 RepID=UPI0038163075